MKKVFLLLVLMVAMVSAVSAATVRVHVVDQDSANLQGVVVAPEWNIGASGWGDFFPKEKTTNVNGIASAPLGWNVLAGTTIQVNYATIDGYTCTSKDVTKMVAHTGQNTLEVVCTENSIPEFTLVGTMLGLVIVAGMFVAMRRR